ncbi:hypothetical protein CCR75_008893 [Bremia lactucae]|uniref:EF-hand domain-containing protein n=1 Tax=Bremia lactucae TaxID=4779 RepID=A0A976P051_BRELC|nr:hypothetical protein CCR75_008893 [Bremia lactucae]
MLGAPALGRLLARQSVSVLGLTALGVMATITGRDTEMHSLGEKGLVAAVNFRDSDDKSTRLGAGRRLILKQRSKHQAHIQEVDQMKKYLNEYKQRREAIDSLRTRFNMYASKSVETSDGRCVKVMTCTDFLHSFVLPQFHFRSPRPDVTYVCDFMGDANGLVTYEEYYVLVHLLQIPKEHFDVAFAMFDLDEDGSVDKAEFCAVIEKLLQAMSPREEEERIAISAENTLPRLTKSLFGLFGKTITAIELEVTLDKLRKQILRAEFDLYATVHPLTKQQTVSVHDFALTLISGHDPKKLPPYLDRVQALNACDDVVTWDEFCTFHFNVQHNLPDIKLAFELTGADEITEAEFIRAARIVSGVELSSPVVELAFRIFDENGNGTLDRSELFEGLKMRNTVELKQKSSGRSQLGKLWQCVKAGDKSRRL